MNTARLLALLRCCVLLALVLAGPTAPAQTKPAALSYPHLADYDAEPRRGDGHVDTDALAQRLQQLGVTTYYWLIIHAATDWEDLQLFLPKAAQAHINVWVYLVPPTESAPREGTTYMEPFRLDYLRWGEEIARLSLQHTNLTAWVIDDFYANHDLFTPAYVGHMQQRAKTINPRLAFLPLMYFNEIRRSFVDDYRQVIDGVVVAYPQDRLQIDNAWALLNDAAVVNPGELGFPDSTKSEPGDFVSIGQSAKVLPGARHWVKFRERDDYTGPTDGYHYKQLLLDGAVIWEQDIAGGTNAWQEIAVDVGQQAQGRANVMLAFRLLDKRGVGNFGVRWQLAGLEAEGLQLGADLSQPAAWQLVQKGAFEAGFGDRLRQGEHRFHVPFIVMTAAQEIEFRLRHGDPAGPERIASWVDMCLQAWQEGKCDGVVTYCLDKTPQSRTFPLVQKLFQPFVGGHTLGVFQGQSEVGHPGKAGSAAFEATAQDYVVAGGGANIWGTNDNFHFVWKRLTGNFSLAADVEGLGAGKGDPHRKACLMVRQSLSPDAAYVDVAVHGSGLTSLQWREQAGGQTHEVQANLDGPARVGLERQGEVFFMSVAPKDGRLENSGAYSRVKLTDPVYVGLAVCAHNDKALEQARFSRVELLEKPLAASAKPVLHCTLETIPVRAHDRRAVYHTLEHIEAPNWSRDGRFFVFNSDGHLHRLPVGGGQPELIDTGFAQRCNNDHGLSPDGTHLAISDGTRTGKSLVYVLPAAGGTPRQVTATGPSYWHGWSPDGSTLAFCGERNGNFDIYTIPADGGQETRLTTAEGLDDGPDYTADGKFIYFNSERTGTMQIWRMRPDGSAQEQVTSDEFNNWFPHPSPDGKWLVFLSYEKGVAGHPANQTVRLRLMPLAGGPIQELAKFFGGQGTINVPSWSPDSQKLAYVTYELLSP